jgi:uncharacterized protein YndB with AHSA1/START domain
LASAGKSDRQNKGVFVPSVVNTVIIAGSAAAVFDLATTARFWPQWHPASHTVGGVTQRPYQLGDLIHERGEVAGIPFQVTWKVEAHARPSRAVLRAETPPARIIYTFEGRSGATEFRRELEYDPATFRAGAPDPDALVRLMHTQSEEALRRLKELVEKTLREEAAAPPPYRAG